jgi:predicted adenylyl cyclase CyaB
MRRNIELKARLSDPSAAQAIAAQLCNGQFETQRQTDTYFHCPSGRLKLREINGREAQLVWYQRPDQSAAKGSDYLLVPVAEPALLHAALSGALGVRGVVRKTRRVYLYQNVRIHLDEVEGLGSFLEFEAVLDDGMSDEAGHAQLAQLRREFGLSETDLLAGSYGDML